MATIAADDLGRRRGDRAFFGHPRGLGFLSVAEAFERFSYYGMVALLPLYGAKQLFLPGHIERIWGFAGFRALLEGLYGPLTPLTLGGSIAALYGSFVYLTPILGGLIADRLTGRTRAVIAGASLMTLGHFLMAFDQTYLVALACLLSGVGLFKGNIAAQVGDLYAPGDLRRADAFQVYFLGIQIAVILAPIVCGTLGEDYAWHWGFGAAGIGMLIGLTIYLSGRRWLPPEPAPARGRIAEPRPKLAAGEGKRVAVLLFLVPVLALASVGNQQIFAAYELWGDAHYQLTLFGVPMAASYLISEDAFVSTIMMFGVIAFWRWWGRHHEEPDEITKLTIGAAIAALAPLCLVAGSIQAAAAGTRVSLAWGLGFHILNDIGFSNVFPVGLALFSRAAPRALEGTMVAVYYLNLFLCGLLVSWLAKLLDRLSSVEFWLTHTIIMAVAVVIFLVARSAAGRLLAPTVDPEAPTDARAVTA